MQFKNICQEANQNSYDDCNESLLGKDCMVYLECYRPWDLFKKKPQDEMIKGTCVKILIGLGNN